MFHNYDLYTLLSIIIILHISNTLSAQCNTIRICPSPCLSLAGIEIMDDARNRLNNITSYIDAEGPNLIVHSVNWFRYDRKNPDRIVGWNGNNSNNDTIILTTMPLIGYYSCDDTVYIDWVLGFSKTLGIDELNIDYEGGIDYPEEFEAYYRERSWDSWFPALLNRAAKYDITISVMYEPKSIAGRLAIRKGKYGPVEIADPDYHDEALNLLKTDLKTICNKFTVIQDKNGKLIVNPAYKRVAGLPVIWVFGMTAGSLTEDIWEQAIKDLFNEGYAFVLVSNSYSESQAGFDTLIQGLNPWLDQLFTGFQTNYTELWDAAQSAAENGNQQESKQIANRYIDEIDDKGLQTAAPVREVKGPGHFNITPLAIGFQDADVDAWGFRPPVFIEAFDRTCSEPGKLFRAYFTAAQKSRNNWYLVCSGDDMAEHTHLLIPDIEYGFSGPYAIALVSLYLGKDPDIPEAIRITEDYIRIKNEGDIPEEIMQIIKDSKITLPAQLDYEAKSFIQ